MNGPSGFDRTLADWLDDMGAQDAPSRLEDAVIEAAQRTQRSRPLPDLLTRWLPMTTNFPATRHAPLGRSMPLARLALALTLLTLALLGAALLASIASPSPAVPVRNGRIAFDLDNDIYTVAPDGSDRRLLVKVSDGPLAGVAWSPDGTRLAYWTEGVDTDWRLTVVHADGSDPIVVASGDASTAGISGFGVAWSLDSSQLAFNAYGEGQLPDRFMVTAADGTTGAVQVGDPDVGVRDAAWSPDGKTIAFGSGDGDGLYLMDADGTDVRRLDTVGGPGWTFVDVDWSPDGRTIAAAAGPSKETWDIWEFAVDGSTERMVSEPLEVPAEQNKLAYAPDGALAWKGGDATMLLEPGGTPQPLAGFVGEPVWSPDGLVMATRLDDGDRSLVIIDRDGKIVTTIGGGHNFVSWQRVPG
jgi:dipeptidyl aminopeptidase/acylaminoacyl peptidase